MEFWSSVDLQIALRLLFQLLIGIWISQWAECSLSPWLMGRCVMGELLDLSNVPKFKKKKNSKIGEWKWLMAPSNVWNMQILSYCYLNHLFGLCIRKSHLGAEQPIILTLIRWWLQLQLLFSQVNFLEQINIISSTWYTTMALVNTFSPIPINREQQQKIS